MNKNQKRVSKITRLLLNNEKWLYDGWCKSFYKMRKFVRKEDL